MDFPRPGNMPWSKEATMELAARGASVTVVARDLKTLQAVVRQLETRCPPRKFRNPDQRWPFSDRDKRTWRLW
jgi:hypothetical protein